MRRLLARPRLCLGLWIVFWCGLFIITHVHFPAAGAPRFKYADKVAHFVLYAVLTWLGGMRLLSSAGGGSAIGLFAWAFVYALYGVLDEWLQQFVERTPDPGDWVANVLGITVTTVVLACYRGQRVRDSP